jgi:hypothetical protein
LVACFTSARALRPRATDDPDELFVDVASIAGIDSPSSLREVRLGYRESGVLRLT